jgi:putative transcriptional regulator
MEINDLCRLNLFGRGLVGTLIWLHAATYANGVDRIEKWQAGMKRQRKPRKDLSVTVTLLGANNTSARRHHGNIPSVDVTAIRQRTGLSQSDFPASIGVPEGALVNWEQGRRQPSGAAKVLLALLAKKPNLVVQLYPSPQPRQRWAPGPPHRNTMTADERLAEIGEILVTGILRMRESTRLREPCGIMPVLIWHGSTASSEN